MQIMPYWIEKFIHELEKVSQKFSNVYAKTVTSPGIRKQCKYLKAPCKFISMQHISKL